MLNSARAVRSSKVPVYDQVAVDVCGGNCWNQITKISFWWGGESRRPMLHGRSGTLTTMRLILI
jgi:hypothetical protein